MLTRLSGALLTWLLLTVTAVAEERRFVCPVEGFTMYRDPGATGALEVVLRNDVPGSVELHGMWGDIVLTAQRIELLPETSFGEALAEVPMPMPDRTKIDACIAEAEKKDPHVMRGRRDSEVLAACKSAAPMVESAALLTFQIIAMSPTEAHAFIKRAHVGEDEEARRRHGVETMALCTPMR
jgi:hypothetical protein